MRGCALPGLPAVSRRPTPRAFAFAARAQDAAEAVRSLDDAAFACHDDVAALLFCLPTDEERKALEVGGWVGGPGGHRLLPAHTPCNAPHAVPRARRPARQPVSPGLRPCQRPAPLASAHPTLQAYLASGKPLSGLCEAEQLVASLMGVPRAASRLRTLSLRFAVDEKAAHAEAVLRVRGARACVWTGGARRLARARPGHAVWPRGRTSGRASQNLYPPPPRRRTTSPRAASSRARPRWRRCWG